MRSTPLLTFVGALLAAFVSMTATSSAQTATGQLTGTGARCDRSGDGQRESGRDE